MKGEDWIGRELADIKRQMQQDRAANPFGPMGILPRKGGIDVQGFVNSLRLDGTKGVAMDDDGVFIVYGPDGTTPVARFGPLESAPGEYGVEVLVGATWVQLGAQAVTWDLVAGKPADFASLVTSAVANATDAVNAEEAAHALDADGSEYGWTNNVAGTEFYALWVGNDGGFHLGRNVSSIKYKENVTDATLAPEAVLNLRPVRYDRKPSGTNGEFPGAKGEFGLIAEEVAQHVPEIVTKFQGEIDGVRYDLLAVALLPVLQRHEQIIKEQGEEIARLKNLMSMKGSV
ncbi:tail fiber domain-containing protein [Arthrobacter sp. B10-11]|uniref:tail fiber domain-containing protein n=1 Tax=Arthrobacter sp. B10-11 TaxID=3081160 RepID=UPI0029530415|nr:tail fiber domain-containing protein [Arthrobacter sp. B10-11]MDV8148541.1 tail fiber domain-containing protein [Arthrobacter sp. B10-11]